MKVTTLLILISTSIFSVTTFHWNPEDYSGIPADDVKVIFFDDFNNDKRFWKKSDFKKAKVSIGNGVCEFTAKDEEEIWQEFVMDKDGFELETSISFGKSKSNAPLNIFINGSRDQMLTFSIYPSGYYQSSIINGDNKKDYISRTPSASINPKNNKITIRKVDNILYFFINEQLTASRTTPKLSGIRYGFLSSKNDLVINYFIMSDLVRDKRNTDFNTKSGEPLDIEEKGRYKMYDKK